MVAPDPGTIEGLRASYERGEGLVGFRSACGFVTATWGLVCPACGARDLERTPLSGRGRLVAFTVQTVPADEFLNEAPYAYVVVALDEGGRISGWIAGTPPEGALALGDRVRWVPGYKTGVQFEREPAP